MRELPFCIQNRRGDPVYGDLRFDEAAVEAPVVVTCHGFKGFKDWGFFPEWGRRLAEAGFVSILFNFSYSGVTPEHPDVFERLDLFADNTYTRELDDLAAVVDAVAGGQFAGAPLDPERLGLMGHSRGGGIALLHAAADARVRAQATWSAVAGLIERFTPEQVDDWDRRGYTEVLNVRTGQRMRLNRVLYDDALAHRERLDIVAAAARLEAPWLIVHAEDDSTVPFDDALQLQETAARAELVRAVGGHTFGARHPLEPPLPEALCVVFDRTLHFFKETL